MPPSSSLARHSPQTISLRFSLSIYAVGDCLCSWDYDVSFEDSYDGEALLINTKERKVKTVKKKSVRDCNTRD